MQLATVRQGREEGGGKRKEGHVIVSWTRFRGLDNYGKLYNNCCYLHPNTCKIRGEYGIHLLQFDWSEYISTTSHYILHVDC